MGTGVVAGPDRFARGFSGGAFLVIGACFSVGGGACPGRVIGGRQTMKQFCGGGAGLRTDGDEDDGPEGVVDDVEELDWLLLEELDALRFASGIGLVGITPVAYAPAQPSTLATYSIERLYRRTAATRVPSAMMSATPAQR